MNGASPGMRTIVARPLFRWVWVIYILLLGAITVGAYFLHIAALIVQAGLLFAAGAMVFAVVALAVKEEWNTVVERNELNSMLAAIDDGMIVYDGTFKVIFFNTAAEKIFKLDSRTVVGHQLSPRDVERDGWRVLTQVVFPSLAPQVVVLSPEGQATSVAEISFADPEFECRVTTAPIVDERGATLAFLKLIRDLTPQRAALRAKDDFITVASHQLRGPVTDINWALESLKSSTALDESDRSIVENAAAASRGLLRRIEDFLDLSRLEGGRMAYEFQPADIAAFLQKMLADLEPAAQTAGIKLYFDQPQTALPQVQIDEKRLGIVIVNLVENAIRYNIENGEVIMKVEATPGKPFIEISVRDTGIGIPPEAISKLFTKFYRAENAVKSQTEGSGIGLYVARGIVRAHGGEIWAESELGRGTTIHFTLPTDPSLVPKHEVTSGGPF